MNSEFTTFIESLRNEKNSELIDTMVEGLSFALGNQLRSNDQLKESTDHLGNAINKLEDLFNELGMQNELEFSRSLGGYIRQVIEQGKFSYDFVDSLIEKLKQVSKNIASNYTGRIPDSEIQEIGLLFDDIIGDMRLAVSLM